MVRLRAVRVKSEGGGISEAVDIRRPIVIEMDYEVLASGYILLPHFHLLNEAGELFLSLWISIHSGRGDLVQRDFFEAMSQYLVICCRRGQHM